MERPAGNAGDLEIDARAAIGGIGAAITSSAGCLRVFRRRGPGCRWSVSGILIGRERDGGVRCALVRSNGVGVSPGVTLIITRGGRASTCTRMKMRRTATRPAAPLRARASAAAVGGKARRVRFQALDRICIFVTFCAVDDTTRVRLAWRQESSRTRCSLLSAESANSARW